MPDSEVYLRDDPGRRGQLTGRTRQRSDGMVYQVRWRDNNIPNWVPGYELEYVEDSPDDAFSLLEEKRFGRPNDLRRNLTFIHLSGKLADMVYSMDTTNTKFLPYQYKPVLTFLESPSNGILIADEVGLGKTIEAGLIWTELRARYNARRLVVVCPAMLREKWCDELRTKFGVDAVQLSADELHKELSRNRHEIREGKGYVCSLQGLRPPVGWRNPEEQQGMSTQLARMLDKLTEEVEPAIDLLIIDEAHYLRNPETQSAVLGGLLREVSEHVVLLSATPVNNRERDLFTLLRLVDPDTFAVESVFPQVLAANEPLLKARHKALDPDAKGADIKRHLQNAAEHPLLEGNQQLEGLLNRNFSDEYLTERANRVELANRIERMNLLSHTVNRTRKIEVEEERVVRVPHSQFVALDGEGPEREFYQRVTESIRDYAHNHEISDGFLLASPQRQVSSCMYAAAKSWEARADAKIPDLESLLYEDLGADDIKITNFSPLIQHIASNVLPHIDIDVLRRTDTKYEKFSQVVGEYLEKYPDEKIIVFSYFKGTLRYLSERLKAEGLRAELLHGGISETKQDVIDRFSEDPEIRVLLASEVASEGVDLQFSRVLINYDLPWNPMKIEQRIGRIDRIGQQADSITIWSLGCADTIDERIYKRLLDRLHIFERALGGMEAILGEKIKELTSDLLSKPLTSEEEEKRIDAAYTAIENIRQQQEELERNAAHLIAHGGYILERVKAAHEFKRRITDHDLKIYVKDYLDRYCAGFEFVESNTDPMTVKIKLPVPTAAQFARFIDDNRLHGQSGLVGVNAVNCHFENKVRKPRQRDEVISQLHPFIRFISSELTERNEGFYPLIAVRLSHQALPELESGIFAFSAKRWIFSGMRMDEYLRARAMLLGSDDLLDSDRSSGLVNAARVEGNDWLAVKNDIDIEVVREAFDKCDMRLEEDYRVTRSDHENENADRIAFQAKSASQHKERLLAIQRGLLTRYRDENNDTLVRLTEGKIQAISSRFDVQIETFRQREEMTSHYSDVVYGVIRVD